MISVNQGNSSCCTLCPALCRLELGWRGPDIPAVEYPSEAGTGLCPRGSALGELLGSPRRIRRAIIGGAEAVPDEAIAAAAEHIRGGATVLIDGNLPLEEIAAAAEIVSAWEGVRLCCVISPEDEQLLPGIEAAGATYLADEDLAGCDGFVIVGDAFAANPRCARGVLDARSANRRAPVVVIDSGGGVTGNFATLRLTCGPGGEADALAGEQTASAVKDCKKLGVIVSAEPGRGPVWRRVGYLAGKLASDHGGGVSAQTVGANALAAVRLRERLGLISLAEAIGGTVVPAVGDSTGETPVPRTPVVPIGVDVLGLLGWVGPAFAVAAAPLPNRTTESARIVLPVALVCETGGTFLQAGTRTVETAALMAPPAGVPTVSELLRSLATAAGVRTPQWSGKIPATERISAAVPDEVPFVPVDGKVLVAARQAGYHAEGALTAHAGWQKDSRPLPELRVSPADADELGLADLAEVEVRTESHNTNARVRVVRHMRPGTLAISEGFPEARRLIPYVIDTEHDIVVSHPAAVSIVKADSSAAASGAGAAGARK